MPFHDKTTYNKIYEMLNDGTAKKYPHIFQGLQITNRLLCQSTVIKDFLTQFDILLFDRWNASSYAYGRAAGLTTEELMTILPLVADPDLTIILDGPTFHKAKLDDYERDAELQKNVRNYYREWAEMQTSQHVVILDASASIEDIAAEIWSIVSGHIPQLNDNVVNLAQYRKKEK
jgi:thymidylate kinase